MSLKNLVFALRAISTNAVFFTNDVASQNYLWNQFKVDFNKKYDSAEDMKRFNIFVNKFEGY